MVKTREISAALREQCIGVYKGGSSITKISNTLKVNKSTIYYIIQRWKLNGSTRNSTRSGRPSLISKRGCRQLKGIVKKEPKDES